MFIVMSNVIQCLTIDRLHIIGDIFDRGPGPHFIFDTLARFAMEVYENSFCKPYQPKVMQNSGVTERDVLLMAQMHKAISVIQFKIEGEMIKRHPEYKMEGRASREKNFLYLR